MQRTEFQGFDLARQLMANYEKRACVAEHLELTPFLDNRQVVAVHVDTAFRADRVPVTAFDLAGKPVGHDVIYIDDPCQVPWPVPSFDASALGMAQTAPEGSALQAALRADGWVVHLERLREYNIDDDRRTTQRKIFVAHMQDMIATGQVEITVTPPGGRSGDDAA